MLPTIAPSASTSKHRPVPKTRTIDPDAPEFPTLPIISFESIAEFAKESQEALLGSVPQISTTDLASLFLPLLSPHQLQQRFKVKQNSVFVVLRKVAYRLLKADVDSLDLDEYSGLYVTGPVGVGKSYLLYQLAAEYRMDRNVYRVTYINDCAMWRGRPCLYLLEELVTTFYDDIIEEMSIMDWCQSVKSSSEKRDNMLALIDALINYVRQKKLQWIVICDQHNALFNPALVKEFPFNIIIDNLAKNRVAQIKVIMSASANNEGYPTEMPGWDTHTVSSRRFDNSEFKEWCNHYLLEDNIKVNHESEEAIDALFWTGGVPYEVDLLWKQTKKTLIEKTQLYRRERVRQMMESHGKFSDRLSNEKKLNLKECVTRMTLGLSPPVGLVGMDRQLFDIILDEIGNEIIIALNSVARHAMMEYHGQNLLTSVEFVAKLVLEGDEYTNDTKGRVIEKYITTTLELTRRFSFSFRKTTSIGLSTLNPVVKKVEIKEIVHFSGNKLPLPNSFNKRTATLFVPRSPNYPGLDFFIWNAAEEVLMAFQVTIKQPFISHPKIDENSANCKLWLEFCHGTSDGKTMEVYWIIPSNCVGKPKGFKGRVVLFEDLYEDFHALRKLTLRPYDIIDT